MSTDDQQKLDKLVTDLAEKLSMDRKPVQSEKQKSEIDRQRTALSHWLQLKRRNAA